MPKKISEFTQSMLCRIAEETGKLLVNDPYFSVVASEKALAPLEPVLSPLQRAQVDKYFAALLNESWWQHWYYWYYSIEPSQVDSYITDSLRAIREGTAHKNTSPGMIALFCAFSEGKLDLLISNITAPELKKSVQHVYHAWRSIRSFSIDWFEQVNKNYKAIGRWLWLTQLMNSPSYMDIRYSDTTGHSLRVLQLDKSAALKGRDSAIPEKIIPEQELRDASQQYEAAYWWQREEKERLRKKYGFDIPTVSLSWDVIWIKQVHSLFKKPATVLNGLEGLAALNNLAKVASVDVKNKLNKWNISPLQAAQNKLQKTQARFIERYNDFQNFIFNQPNKEDQKKINEIYNTYYILLREQWLNLNDFLQYKSPEFQLDDFIKNWNEHKEVENNLLNKLMTQKYSCADFDLTPALTHFNILKAELDDCWILIYSQMMEKKYPSESSEFWICNADAWGRLAEYKQAITRYETFIQTMRDSAEIISFLPVWRQAYKNVLEQNSWGDDDHYQPGKIFILKNSFKHPEFKKETNALIKRLRALNVKIENKAQEERLANDPASMLESMRNSFLHEVEEIFKMKGDDKEMLLTAGLEKLKQFKVTPEKVLAHPVVSLSPSFNAQLDAQSQVFEIERKQVQEYLGALIELLKDVNLADDLQIKKQKTFKLITAMHPDRAHLSGALMNGVTHLLTVHLREKMVEMLKTHKHRLDAIGAESAAKNLMDALTLMGEMFQQLMSPDPQGLTTTCLLAIPSKEKLRGIKTTFEKIKDQTSEVVATDFLFVYKTVEMLQDAYEIWRQVSVTENGMRLASLANGLSLLPQSLLTNGWNPPPSPSSSSSSLSSEPVEEERDSMKLKSMLSSTNSPKAIQFAK